MTVPCPTPGWLCPLLAGVLLLNPCAGHCGEGQPSPASRSERADILLRLGRYAEAADVLQATVKRNPLELKARASLVRALHLLGRNEESDRHIEWFYNYYNDYLADDPDAPPAALMHVASAVRNEVPMSRDSMKTAFDLLVEARERDPSLAEAYLQAGELALDISHYEHARDEFRGLTSHKDAGRNFSTEHLARAHLGLARVARVAPGLVSDSEDEEVVRVQLAAARKLDPELPDTYLLEAELALQEGDTSAAVALVEKALSCAPSHPATLSMLAAIRCVDQGADNRECAQAVAAACKGARNRAFVYASIASVLELVYRTSDAVRFAVEAARSDPLNWKANSLAGLNLARAGEEKRAYNYLQRALKLNPFDVRVSNMLTVLDKDLKEGLFSRTETRHLQLRLDRRDELVLGPELAERMEEYYNEFAAKYGLGPVGPDEAGGKILVEMFHNPDDFSARVAGLPGIPALGASLERVVLLPSPRAYQQSRHRFNWARVARHELAHVFTLQLTGSRIPRWLTEGISIYEEGEQMLETDGAFARAYRSGGLPGLFQLQREFARPKSRKRFQVGYYQAGLIVHYVVETYGEKVLPAACRLVRDGTPAPEALAAASGRTLEQVEAELANVYARRAARIPSGRLRPEVESLLKAGRVEQALERLPTVDCTADDGLLYTRAGILLAQAGKKEEAVEALQMGIANAPRCVRPTRDAAENPYHLLARLLKQLGRGEESAAILEKALRMDLADYDAAIQLARQYEESGNAAKAVAAARRAVEIAPFNTEPYRILSRTYEKLGELHRAGQARRITGLLNLEE